MSLLVRWPGLTGCAGAMLLGFLPMLVAAEDEASDPGTPPSEPEVLVLNSGRLVEGRISQSAGGFVVEKSRGRMLVPFQHVRLQAADRQNAYRKLRKSVPEFSAPEHLQLAQWCLTYQLYDECASELRAVLKIAPDHREARSMLRRLEEIVHPDQPTHTTVSPPQPRSEERFKPPDATSLAGLPRESARQFVTQIQPILLNNCGNAGCHGSAAKNGFRLVNVPLGRGSHRVFAEQNLAQTLEQIDTERPAHSPLLVVPQGSHGRASRPVFHGARAAHQRKALRQWVTAVAAQLRTGTSSAVENASSLQFPSAPGSRGRQSPPVATGGTHRAPPLGFDPPSTLDPRPSQPPALQDDLLQSILRDERPDAFDPEIFNRIVHGSGKDTPQ